MLWNELFENDFFVLSVSSFFSAYDFVQYCSVNKIIYNKYDRDITYKKIYPWLKKFSFSSKILLKKAIHFETLANRYSVKLLIQEVVNITQWHVACTVIRTYAKNGEVILDVVKSMFPPNIIKKRIRFFKPKSKMNYLHVLHLENYSLRKWLQ